MSTIFSCKICNKTFYTEDFSLTHGCCNECCRKACEIMLYGKKKEEERKEARRKALGDEKVWIELPDNDLLLACFPLECRSNRYLAGYIKEVDNGIIDRDVITIKIIRGEL